jgi:hypothetical protein
MNVDSSTTKLRYEVVQPIKCLSMQPSPSRCRIKPPIWSETGHLVDADVIDAELSQPRCDFLGTATIRELCASCHAEPEYAEAIRTAV